MIKEQLKTAKNELAIIEEKHQKDLNERIFISVSPDVEKHMAYCARVSNPNNQDNENYAGC